MLFPLANVRRFGLDPARVLAPFARASSKRIEFSPPERGFDQPLGARVPRIRPDRLRAFKAIAAHTLSLSTTPCTGTQQMLLFTQEPLASRDTRPDLLGERPYCVDCICHSPFRVEAAPVLGAIRCPDAASPYYSMLVKPRTALARRAVSGPCLPARARHRHPTSAEA